tara:strand:- start:18806 stop:19285 length:480 start_codon:yes stop_codon:yes gene_type:complete
MIGNDIVDLALAQKESNWKRPGFLEKIFTLKEQFLIHNAQNSEKMVWNLWSRKEAAYKIYNRETGIRAYIPTQLECIYENATLGRVICKGNTYYTKTQITGDKIHTIAVAKKSFFNQIEYLEPTNQLDKINGIPFFSDGDNIKPVSVSHHGRYKATITI